ncbi:MAG TPA: pyridoxamine 5'-phosphate oxidase family protein [Cyclobacteriaceae bacterium]
METKIENSTEAIDKLRDLVNDVTVCMFTTVDDNGAVTTRPMTTIDCDEDGNLWFFTNEFGEKILEGCYDNNVYLIYSHPGKNTYFHVTGTSNVIVDRIKIEKLWKPILKAWFPQGIADPKLCLIKVITEEAKYWNSTSNKMVVFYNMVKAIAKKEKYEEGEVGTLNLSPQ